jgi:hypothetical protein
MQRRCPEGRPDRQTATHNDGSDQGPGSVDDCPLRTIRVGLVSGRRQLGVRRRESDGDQLGHFGTLLGPWSNPRRPRPGLVTPLP